MALGIHLERACVCILMVGKALCYPFLRLALATALQMGGAVCHWH